MLTALGLAGCGDNHTSDAGAGEQDASEEQDASAADASTDAVVRWTRRIKNELEVGRSFEDLSERLEVAGASAVVLTLARESAQQERRHAELRHELTCVRRSTRTSELGWLPDRGFLSRADSIATVRETVDNVIYPGFALHGLRPTTK